MREEMSAANVATTVEIRHDKNLINSDQDLIERLLLPSNTRGKDAAGLSKHVPSREDQLQEKKQ